MTKPLCKIQVAISIDKGMVWSVYCNELVSVVVTDLDNQLIYEPIVTICPEQVKEQFSVSQELGVVYPNLYETLMEKLTK